MQQPPSTNHDHDTLLELDVDQYITVITPPIWTWHSIDLVTGEYMIGVAPRGANYHDPADSEGAAQLGLLPLARLLDRRVARTITV